MQQTPEQAPASRQEEILGERLNEEPVIFRGYTDSEFMLAMALAGGVCFPVGLFAGVLLGRVSMGIGVAFMAAIGLVVLGAGAYQNWKRGRPVHWLQHRASRRLAEWGLSRGGMLAHQGVMALGRDDIDRRFRRKGGGKP
jgi:conjugative transfer region protein (TIGR03750 family)